MVHCAVRGICYDFDIVSAARYFALAPELFIIAVLFLITFDVIFPDPGTPGLSLTYLKHALLYAILFIFLVREYACVNYRWWQAGILGMLLLGVLLEGQIAEFFIDYLLISEFRPFSYVNLQILLDMAGHYGPVIVMSAWITAGLGRGSADRNEKRPNFDRLSK